MGEFFLEILSPRVIRTGFGASSFVLRIGFLFGVKEAEDFGRIPGKPDGLSFEPAAPELRPGRVLLPSISPGNRPPDCHPSAPESPPRTEPFLSALQALFAQEEASLFPPTMPDTPDPAPDTSAGSSTSSAAP